MVHPVSNLVNVAGQSVDRATLTGLQNASAKSGVSFQYLVAKAAQESSLKTDAQADTSSATGLFQFTRGTWLDMMKKYGSLYGYGDLAQKISTGSDGKTAVTDPAAEKKLMALRGNAEASALMAAEYARDNATNLHETLGRGVDAPDLYLAHFLGAAGAGQLLNAASSEPKTSAASILPAAAKANQSVFYTPEGRARSAAEVVKLVRERFAGQMDRYADVAAAMTGENGEQIAAPERTAAPLPAQFNDVRGALVKAETKATDPTKAMMSHYMLEELAKLIATKPMSMSDGSEEEGAQSDETTLSSNGFQGSDWAAAMSRAVTKNGNLTADQAMLERNIAKGRAGEAKRTYDMLNAVPAVPFVAPRRDDPS